jgi:hypothetical protein
LNTNQLPFPANVAADVMGAALTPPLRCAVLRWPLTPRVRTLGNLGHDRVPRVLALWTKAAFGLGRRTKMAQAVRRSWLPRRQKTMNRTLTLGAERVALAAALALGAACTEDEGDAPINPVPMTTIDSAVTVPSIDGGAPANVDSAVATPSANVGDGGTLQLDAAVSDATAPGPSANDALWCNAKAALAKRCTSCHDGKGTAGTPDKISFANLEDLKKQSPAGAPYYQRVGVRIRATEKPMPPARDATEAELKALEAWITAGASGSASASCDTGDAGTPDGGAKGDAGPYERPWPADCEKHYKVLAHAPGGTGPFMVPVGQEIHPQIIFDAPWGNEDVQVIASRPITDNAKVLHHWILYEQGSGAFLNGWAPGAEDSPDPDPDVGLYMTKGPQSMRLDMHYHNVNGTKVEPDQSGVEFCTVSKAKFRKHTASVFPNFGAFGSLFVLAPANKSNHASTGVCNVVAKEPVTVITASPHAHTLAVGMKFTATVGGKETIMHEGPFVFEEQRSYKLKQPVVLKTGDKVTTTCIFTNPTNRDATFGEDTGNEMCFNFAIYYPVGALSCSVF